MSRKVVYITGTRADYGLMKPVLRKISESPDLTLEIVATGMHCMPEFGSSIQEVMKDNFSVHVIDATYDNDDSRSMVAFMGKFLSLFNNAITEIEPDIILLLGDRAEMLAAAIAGSYRGIPVAHIHGGEVTSTIDEYARHAITKLSHIHLPATIQSAERIRKLGEDPLHIHVVGAPGLDALKDPEPITEIELEKKYTIDMQKPFIIVLQHPVSVEVDKAAAQIRETMDAVLELEIPAIVVYPNADPGGRSMIEVIEKFRNQSFIHIFSNIPHGEFVMLLKRSAAIVGNSSSGIIEAPSLGIAAVNIGDRQDGRERADNVIDVPYRKSAIKEAVINAIKKHAGKRERRRYSSPYGGDGGTSDRIVEILATTPLDDGLLKKRLQYR
jgi:UDP-hydrolysing UDP-N-acetyl-D-glucosamine 2-epimerase